MRTTDFYEKYAKLGNVKKPKYGLKGSVILSEIIEFPNSFPLDYMHLLCLGLFKRIMGSWFDSVNNKMEFYIGNQKSYKKIKHQLKIFKKENKRIKIKFNHKLKNSSFHIH